jgi:transposase
MEQTGHYHRPLLQYLLELDLPVYVMHVQSPEATMLKTEKRDALGLANHLYNQLALGVQVTNKVQVIRRAAPPSEAAAQLKGLMGHRYELVNEATQRKNKLTASCDEIFPELVHVFKNPHLLTALDLREKFPTPPSVATASLTALREVRRRNHPSEAELILLQQLAAASALGQRTLRANAVFCLNKSC